MPDTDNELQFTFEGENISISFDEDVDDKSAQPIEEHEGYNCSRCGEFYRYAKINQPNGTFKCWGCRH